MNTLPWHLLFSRADETNKYDYGHVLIVGGSEAMVGAPVLAARAALRVGAGMVTIASDTKTVELIDRDIEEIMTLSLPSWNEVDKVIATIEEFISERHISTVVIGPGLSELADDAIRTLMVKIKLPMVLDARVFTALSGHLSVLRSAADMHANILLTPHTGEYARLVKVGLLDDHISPTSLERFAKDYNVTVVLKSHHTLVVSAKGQRYKNTTGNPGLATAGSGDVLAGILAGMLAQGVKPYDAAQMAVYLHGLAGDKVAAATTEAGMIASDIIECLPSVLNELEKLRIHSS